MTAAAQLLTVPRSAKGEQVPEARMADIGCSAEAWATRLEIPSNAVPVQLLPLLSVKVGIGASRIHKEIAPQNRSTSAQVDDRVDTLLLPPEQIAAQMFWQLAESAQSPRAPEHAPPL